MPVEWLHVDEEDLPRLGVDAGLLAGFRRYLDGERGGLESVAILAPPEVGTCELLMVLARRVGAALRDANIRLRDRSGDLAARRHTLPISLQYSCSRPYCGRQCLRGSVGHKTIPDRGSIYV